MEEVGKMGNTWCRLPTPRRSLLLGAKRRAQRSASISACADRVEVRHSHLKPATELAEVEDDEEGLDDPDAQAKVLARRQKLKDKMLRKEEKREKEKEDAK
jgi:hypothetical protein